MVGDDGAIGGEGEGGGGLPGWPANRVGVVLPGVARAAPGPRDGGRDQGDRHEQAQQEVAGEPDVRDTYTAEDQPSEHHSLARYHRGESSWGRFFLCIFEMLKVLAFQG